MADRHENQPQAGGTTPPESLTGENDIENDIIQATEAALGRDASEIEVEVHSGQPEHTEQTEQAWNADTHLSRRVQLAQVLADTRVQVDRVLDRINESRIDARRLVTKELWSDPRPEILNTIVNIACNKAEGALPRELPRHLLTVLTLVETKLSDLLNSRELIREEIRADSDMLPELRDLSVQIQEEITAGLNNVSPKLRSHLLQVCNSLVFPDEKASTVMLLAPRLEMFAQIGATTDLRALVPSLSDDETKLLKKMVISGSTDNAPGRNCVNSIALRTLMNEDVERWKRATADTPVNGDVDVDPELIVRMEREKIAYHFLSDRLQTTQDSALVAGLSGFANEVGGFRQNLFATYLDFKPAYKGVTKGTNCEDASPDSSPLVSLIEESESPTAESLETNSETSELYMKALEHVSRAEANAAKAKSQPDKRETTEAVAVPEETPLVAPEDVVIMLPVEISNGTRLSVLGGIAIVLTCICASLYLPSFLSPSQAPELDAEAFGSAYALTEVVSGGGLLYARVSEWSWNDLSPTERMEKMEELGAIARSHHVKGAILVARDGRELAQWNRATGAKLIETTP